MMRTATQIPNKLYFRIGEVADLLSVKPYVLRYWETEFADIKPAKSKSGQRLYKRRDVEMLVQIKELLYQERFTINGARKRLKELVREQRSQEHNGQVALPMAPAEQTAPAVSTKSSPQTLDSRKVFGKIKKDLESIAGLLGSR